LKFYVDLVNKERAWTLMNKPDGSFFGSWEEFCEHRQPWGLGKPWDQLRPFIEAAVGKQALQLATVAPAKPPQAGPGRGHTQTDKTHYPEDSLFTPAAPAHEARLRAIAERAPEPVRELYRDGLIGAKEAAALGPKNPTPEEAAKVTEVAIAAKQVATEAKPKTPKEKMAVKKTVNAVVREMTGREPDPVALAANALAKVPPHRLAELVARLDPGFRRDLVIALDAACERCA